VDEANAFVVSSRTETAGADIRTAGIIGDTIDMGDYGFGSNHSAEFLMTPQETSDFYDQLLTTFSIAPLQ
jgi:hypothetical protein